MPLKRFDKKEPQGRYTINRCARRELALLEKIGLVGSKVVGTELVGRLAEILGEVGHDPQVLACGNLGVIATLEFLQHHLS